jgi:hypothetical protein
MEDLHVRRGDEGVRQPRVVGQVQLDQHGAVARPQHLAQDLGRAGVGLRPEARAGPREHVPVGCDQRLDRVIGRWVETGDAVAPLPGAARLVAGEVVAANAGMRVDGPEGAVLLQ